MRRRDFLTTAAVGTAAAATAGHATALTRETVSSLYFDSTSALLNASMEPLTDDSVVAVWAHESASTTDEDGNGDTVPYPNSRPPLVGVDGSVVGFGAPFATDDTDFSYGNDEFLLNVWDEHVGGGTVLWDEGHGQYYTLSKFSRFESYAESNGYTVEPTTSLADDLSGADAAVVTSPNAFSQSERDALASFAADGGAVFLHHQADYGGYDRTAALNDIASALGVTFRFNDTEIVDPQHNVGAPYVLLTDQFNTAFPYFAGRTGIGSGPTYEFGTRYAATVTNVSDGDTFDVELDGGATETIRVLGVDTPEKTVNADAENPYEWEGLGDDDGDDRDGDYPYLAEWAATATGFATQRLEGKTVEFAFDPAEGISGPYGRLLAEVYVDADGSGSYDTGWSETMVASGHGRVYDSGYSGHDALVVKELAAREAGTGVWAESDPAESSTVANTAVDALALPNAAPITASGSGGVPDDAVIVAARSSASAAGSPLVAADAANRVALVGSPLAADGYDFLAVEDDATPYGNYAFLTNLASALAARDGYLAIDGGHGQFSASYAVSAEDAQTYQRYLEGVDRGIEGVNDYASGVLDDASAVLVTSPPDELGDGELDALRSFRDDGGAIVLLASSAAPSGPTVRQNAIAAGLGTSLQFGLGGVTDPRHNVDGNAAYPTTNAFPGPDGLFAAYDGTAALDATTTTTGATTDDDASGSTPGFGALTAAAGVLGGAAHAVRTRLPNE